MPADLLYEIGVEEIPANAVLPALSQLETAIGEGLDRLRLDHGPIATYGTPRRLAIIVNDVDDRQEDAVEEIKGPPAHAAFDAQGNPTKAAMGFASSRGVELSDLQVRTVDNGEWVFARVSRPGQPATEVLPQLLKQATEELSFPKTMWWAEVGFRFARPLRWLVALLGEQLLDLEIAGVRATQTTRGHRVLGTDSIEIDHPSRYLAVLETNGVIADHRRRREMIVQQATELAAAQGYRPRIDPDILTEVNFLVEYPVCVIGSFDSEYLQLPQEIIVTVLQGHQKAFPVEDEQGNLAPNFIAVTNADPAAADTVCSGWEKVIVPRLDDAQFYYEQDMGQPLAERREALKRVTFMEKLGTLYDQSDRLAKLTSWLAEYLDEVSELEAQTARRAAELAKCDQVTMMVRDGKLGEVLQG
ncbi:MAG: glycine--tRNA ligase subunit beta, partial [Armatimonadetes bacterium]|nr:glycine--tRNA ligase subunit beta [Armatimonadota bacterium]